MCKSDILIFIFFIACRIWLFEILFFKTVLFENCNEGVENSQMLRIQQWSAMFISMMMSHLMFYTVIIVYQTENILCWTFFPKIYGNSSGNLSADVAYYSLHCKCDNINAHISIFAHFKVLQPDLIPYHLWY